MFGFWCHNPPWRWTPLRPPKFSTPLGSHVTYHAYDKRRHVALAKRRREGVGGQVPPSIQKNISFEPKLVELEWGIIIGI